MVAKQHTFLEIVEEIHRKLLADVYKSFDESPHNCIKVRAGFCENSLANLTLSSMDNISMEVVYYFLRTSILLKLLYQKQTLRSTQLKHLSQTGLYLL